ncbi:serine/threonine protein kinase [archaeon]|nr:MAG: serine/threonine protein kinase [archaeon]
MTRVEVENGATRTTGCAQTAANKQQSVPAEGTGTATAAPPVAPRTPSLAPPPAAPAAPEETGTNTLPVVAATTSSIHALCHIRFEDIHFDRQANGLPVELGEGGFGVVLAGTFSGDRVAIKKLRMPAALAKKKFWHEVLTQTRASHRHVVRVLGAAVQPVDDTNEVYCFVVMERMEIDLRRAMYTSLPTRHPAARLQQQLHGLPYRLHLLLGVARGVRYLHTKGIVHGDLKPANVMLSADGSAQLTDFGTAVQRRLDASRTHTLETGRGGTPVYVDPAFAFGDSSVKPASDMYAWGVLAWEVLTFCNPNEALTYSSDDTLTSAGAGAGAAAVPLSAPTLVHPPFSHALIHGERPESVLAGLTGVPPALHELIVRCWSAEQAARPSADDAVRVLERVVHDASVPVEAPTAAAPRACQ